MVRDHFSAILIVCDLNSGSPKEFYSVKGSIGDSLSISPQGMLLWDVGSLVSAGYHPYFSAYSISCTCCIFQYTFDASGALLQQKKTDKICGFYR